MGPGQGMGNRGGMGGRNQGMGSQGMGNQGMGGNMEGGNSNMGGSPMGNNMGNRGGPMNQDRMMERREQRGGGDEYFENKRPRRY